MGHGEKLCHKCMYDRAIPVRYCRLVVNLNNKIKRNAFINVFFYQCGLCVAYMKS